MCCVHCKQYDESMLYIDGRFLSYNDKNDFDTPVLKSKLPFDATVNSYLSIYSMPCN